MLGSQALQLVSEAAGNNIDGSQREDRSRGGRNLWNKNSQVYLKPEAEIYPTIRSLISQTNAFAFQMPPRQVKVKFAFLTVGDVDTKSQRFVAEVLIQAKWVEPKLRGLTSVSFNDSVTILNRLMREPFIRNKCLKGLSW